MIAPEDLEALGFPPGASPSPSEVSKAWRHLCMTGRIHPDHGGDAENFKNLNATFRRVLALAETTPCDTCGGRGKIERRRGAYSMWLTCQTCHGDGEKY